jgi:hypothetical protein
MPSSSPARSRRSPRRSNARDELAPRSRGSEAVSEDRRVARAALCASAMLLWLALPGRSPLPVECTEPGERTSQDGWTLTADCLSESENLSPVRGPARRLFGLPLDPNRASPASLETLPGIRGQRPSQGCDRRLLFASSPSSSGFPGSDPGPSRSSRDFWRSIHLHVPVVRKSAMLPRVPATPAGG